MLKVLLIPWIYLSISLPADKGASGAYKMKGTAFVEFAIIIMNGNIQLIFSEKEWFVKTDPWGRFSVNIPWSTPCPSGISTQKRKQMTIKMNPEKYSSSFTVKC